MRLHRILRWFVAGEIGLVVLGVSAGLWLQESLPEPLRQYLGAENDREWSSADTWQAVVWVPIWGLLVAGWIGLWHLKSWSRVIYTTAWGLALLAAPLLGPSVMNGVEAALGEAAALAAGVTLSLIWFSSLSDQFRPRPPNSSMQPTRENRPAAG